LTYQPPQDPNQPYQQGPPQPGPGYPAPGTGQQPPGAGPYAPGGQAPGPQPRRKRRRVFLWVFLVIQALFLILVIVGVAGTNNAPSHGQLVADCYNNRWFPAFNSQAACVASESKSLTADGDITEGLGVVVELVVWFVVDAVFLVGYWIYRLATRNRRAAA
jgi:hypothetical protein